MEKNTSIRTAVVYACLLCLLCTAAAARTRTSGNCAQGGNTVLTAGVQSSSFVQASFPGCLVTVTLTGTQTLATLYSDNLSTPLSNPFNGDSITGAWYFYTDDGHYDITLSAGGLQNPQTIGDVYVSSVTASNTPGGPAGGDLGGTYPNPTVVGSHQTWGGDLSGTGLTPTVPLVHGLPLNPANFSGADLFAQINSAIASCGSNPCFIRVATPGQAYTVSTTLNLPAQYVDINFSGATVTYSGSGDAITVSPYAPVPYISGRIANLNLVGNASAANGIHQSSRLGMIYENLKVSNFLNAAAACMEWENTASAPGFDEQNTIRKADFNACTKAIKFKQDNGLSTNSFDYNYLTDVHITLTDGQIGLSMEGPGGSFPALAAFGGTYDMKFNINTPTTAAKCISLTGGSDWERSTVSITGEQTSGATQSTAVFTDATSFGYLTGNILITSTNNSIGGAEGTFVTHPSLNLNGAVHYEPNQGTIQQRHCKFDLGPTNPTFWLASYNGGEDNCQFGIIARNTDDTNRDVDIQGTGSAPVTLLTADPLAKTVSVGNNFTVGITPTDKTAHVVVPIQNSDTSFKMVVSAGTSSATFSFARAWQVVPNCVATPNSNLYSPGVNPIVGGWSINPSTSSITLNQWGLITTSSASSTFGFDVTYFVHCFGNPN